MKFMNKQNKILNNKYSNLYNKKIDFYKYWNIREFIIIIVFFIKYLYF